MGKGKFTKGIYPKPLIIKKQDYTLKKYKLPLSVKVGNWFMDTRLPIPLKFWIGDKIKYSRLTPNNFWEDGY